MGSSRLASPGVVLLAAAAALAHAEPAAAGAWVLGAGKGRVELKLLHQDTEERYFLDGERIPYFFEGRNRTSAVFADAWIGLPGSLEASIQASLYRLDFDDLADDRRSTGLGDTRLGLRWNALKRPLVLTLATQVKIPTGDFDNDAEIVPVGEGQYDLDVSLQIGRSLWPRPGYLTGEVGYRLRGANGESGIDPGNELFWSVEAGWKVAGRLSVKMVARGLHGVESTSFGLAIPTLKRKAVYLSPGLILDAGGGRSVTLSVPFTLAGRNWPAGPVVSVGVSQAF